jgi:hypothetical protein
MSEPNTLPIVNSAEPSGLGRREVLQRALGAIGATLALPGLAAGHPMQRHLSNPATVGDADAKARAAKFKPEFLDEHQYATLTSLAERIVPGSTKARVSQFIDSLLTVDSTQSQRGFLQALGAFEGHAIGRFSKPWKALAAAQQTEILDEVSTMVSGREPRAGARGVAEPGAGPAKLSLRDHFDTLKGWISGAYYSSEIGMRELGFTGNVFYAEFPGCKHEGGHL